MAVKVCRDLKAVGIECRVIEGGISGIFIEEQFDEEVDLHEGTSLSVESGVWLTLDEFGSGTSRGKQLG